MTEQTLSVLVVGLGQMGQSHAMAYHAHAGFRIVGLVNRSQRDLPAGLTVYPMLHDYKAALAELKPDVVSISTHTDTHADYAVAALEAGAHVFVEKPLAATVADSHAERRGSSPENGFPPSTGSRCDQRGTADDRSSWSS